MLNHAKDYGLTIEGKIGFDPARSCSARAGLGATECRRRLLAEEEQGRCDLGRGAITSPARLRLAHRRARGPAPGPLPKGILGEGTYQAKHIVVATGARPRVLPGLEPDGKLIWTYFEAMVPDAIPKA